MPEAYGQDDKVDEHRVKRGVAFQWHETKSVKAWIQFLKDIPGLTHVLDFGVGTAAAGIGAWRCGINYEGVCVNQIHKNWLDNLMDSCMFAVVAEGIGTKLVGNDKEFQAKVQHLFGPQVAEGMRMLCAKKAVARAEALANTNDEGKPAGDEQKKNDNDDDDDDEKDH